VYITNTGQTHSLDITQQTHLNKERDVVPHNSEVERIAVSSYGRYLATVYCMWASITRITLKLWSSPRLLATTVSSVRSSVPPSSQPLSPLTHAPLCRRRQQGCDSLGAAGHVSASSPSDSWQQLLVGGAVTAQWRDSGGVALGHIVTLWDTDSNLRTTLAVEDSMEPIISLVFGSNSI
jgi:hypothetical protein